MNKKLNKRKYPAVVYDGGDKDGKWYTGWEGDISLEGDPDHYRKYQTHKIQDGHVSRRLELRYNTYSRGRSAANIHLEDKDGHMYELSMSAFDQLLTATMRPASETTDQYDISMETNLLDGSVWFRGYFVQVKQGQNYFIAPAKKDER